MIRAVIFSMILGALAPVSFGCDDVEHQTQNPQNTQPEQIEAQRVTQAVSQVERWQSDIDAMIKRLCDPKSELPPDSKLCD
tara:strand:+ start:1496 stop:1738 length:243 start_codon:yes stop_codon:yes gene_type:complete